MGRKQKIGGRAICKSFSYPKDFDESIDKIEEVCRREGISFSDLMVTLLKDYVKKHAKSENP